VVREGYQRGWSLQFDGLGEKLRQEAVYRQAWPFADIPSLVSPAKHFNLYLLMTRFLPRLGSRNIIEFGSYKGGNALFMALVMRQVDPEAKVYALDTFEGMPPTDNTVDAHSAGDFRDADLESLQSLIAEKGIDNLVLVKGRFEDTAQAVAREHGPFALAHIDCDIYSAVACAYERVKDAMVPGGYFVFDDATVSSCIGATEAVESLVIRRDGLSSEQISPHFIDLATEVGSELARRGHSLISGGGSVSCMGAVARAARAGGAWTVGIIPEALRLREVADLDADELVVTADMRTRKAEMDRRADVFLVLPGGLGTLEELVEIWAARSLALHDKPIVVLDADGVFAPLREQVALFVELGFARPAAIAEVTWAGDLATAFQQLEGS
jgi:hypothetical protein